MKKHTPGPWINNFDGMPNGAVANEIMADFGSNDICVAVVQGPTTGITGELISEECKANAKLIAAAPDQQAALSMVQARILQSRVADDGTYIINLSEQECAQVRDAISKATA